MTNLQINEDQLLVYPKQTRQKFLTRLVLSTGLVTTEKQVEYVLLGFSFVAILLAITMWVILSPSNSPRPLPPGILIPGPGDGV